MTLAGSSGIRLLRSPPAMDRPAYCSLHSTYSVGARYEGIVFTASKLLRVACCCHLQRKTLKIWVAKVRFLLVTNWGHSCTQWIHLPALHGQWAKSPQFHSRSSTAIQVQGFASFLGICHFRELRVRSRVAIRQLREFRLANSVSFCDWTEEKAIWANRQLRQKLNSRHTCSKLLSKTSRSSKVAVYLYNLVCQCLGGWIELLFQFELFQFVQLLL